MLRLAVVVLLLANLLFFVWTRGWLDDVVGVRASGDREPDRLARQVKPELIRVLPPQQQAAAASAVVPPACLEAGPFAADQIGGADAVLQAALPADVRAGVATVKVDRPGLWLVYMGKYPNREALTKKIDELKRRNVAYDEVKNPPALAGGLSLGRFDDRAAAERALAQFGEQGIHTARVVEASPAGNAFMLRAAAADTALAGRLSALKSDALGRGFAACAPPGAKSATTPP